MLQLSHQCAPQLRLYLSDRQTAEMNMQMAGWKILYGHHCHKQQIPYDHAIFRLISGRSNIHNLCRYNRKDPRR